MLKYTHDEMLDLVKRARERDYNTAIDPNIIENLSVSTERDYNTARCINTEYSNVEYSNVASNPAAEGAKDWLASPATSSPLGVRTSSSEVKEEGLVGQERGVKEIAEEEQPDPRIWGIEAQQCLRETKKVKRSLFHLTIQFYFQVPLEQATLLTVYTYPTDRLRDYGPKSAAEQQILDYVKAEKEKGRILLPGRIMERGQKGDPVDGLTCFVEDQAGVKVMTVMNIFSGETVELMFSRSVTHHQAEHFKYAAKYGNQLAIPGKRRSVSIFNVKTLVGGSR